MGDKCIKNSHLKEILLFCLDCKSSVCAICTKDHRRHDMLDIDTHMNNEKQQIEEINQRVKDRISKLHIKLSKNENSLLKIEETYLASKDLIAKVCKEIVDEIHSKQVELQRELKSNYDDIVENHTIQQSELESDIHTLESSLQIGFTKDTFDLIIDEVNNNNNNNNNNNKTESIYTFPPSTSLKIINQQEDIKNQILLIQLYEKTIAQPPSTIPKTIEQPITPTKTDHTQPNNKVGNFLYIIRCNTRDITIYDLGNKDSRTIQTSNNLTLIGQAMESQSSYTIGRCIYVLTSNCVYKLDLTRTDYAWERKEYVGPYSPPDRFSVIFDGAFSFYLFGYLPSKTYKLDISTFKLTYLGGSCDLPIKKKLYSFGVENIENIHILDNNIIHSLNTVAKSYKSTKVDSLLNGCYVSSTNLFYTFLEGDKPLWCTFNPKTKVLGLLYTFPGKLPFKDNNNFRIHYEILNHSIYVLDSVYNFYKYNIRENRWLLELTLVDMGFDQFSSRNFISFSNFSNKF
ncbi:hypothetical protein DLAC_00540 [Tieghemostelium lacteum]|uniref:B box-type domain-containing protein n=1 Tax=Tieghemostelium lacteum TaxID=361077 RepID=A0A152AA00_TIELA|nr:hypothetical protein DLAC_00540 [Tieghemostelium lacteum]|eukprot:KYR03049.1 hypothetical protein DLAC_00540 [Tieghemostelium lacteum]